MSRMVDIEYAITGVILQKIENPPVPPQPELMLAHHKNIPLTVTRDGDKIVWYPSGQVIVYGLDTTVKTWWPKPKLDDVVNKNVPSYWIRRGAYYQFNTNGSVIVRCDGLNYFWPAG